jgi:hypothetical protein
MKENPGQNWHTPEHDALGRRLDAALAKYTAIEPRAGLEDRILANLRAERGDSQDRAWLRWGVAAVFATVVLVIIGLAWRTAISAPTVAHRPPAMKPQVKLPAPEIGSNRPPDSYSTVKPLAHRSKRAAPANPKLDQFPSPQPLSEQEKILARYVDAYPEHAVLLARARTEALRRDQIEETRSYSQDDGAKDWEDRNEDWNNNQ